MQGHRPTTYSTPFCPHWCYLARMSTATALTLIRQFEARSGKSAFPNLVARATESAQRAEIAKQLRERVATPRLIKQGETSLCGPASFFYTVILRDPEDYVRYAIDLYEKLRQVYACYK